MKVPVRLLVVMLLVTVILFGCSQNQGAHLDNDKIAENVGIKDEATKEENKETTTQPESKNEGEIQVTNEVDVFGGSPFGKLEGRAFVGNVDEMLYVFGEKKENNSSVFLSTGTKDSWLFKNKNILEYKNGVYLDQNGKEVAKGEKPDAQFNGLTNAYGNIVVVGENYQQPMEANIMPKIPYRFFWIDNNGYITKTKRINVNSFHPNGFVNTSKGLYYFVVEEKLIKVYSLENDNQEPEITLDTNKVDMYSGLNYVDFEKGVAYLLSKHSHVLNLKTNEVKTANVDLTGYFVSGKESGNVISTKEITSAKIVSFDDDFNIKSESTIPLPKTAVSKYETFTTFSNSGVSIWSYEKETGTFSLLTIEN